MESHKSHVPKHQPVMIYSSNFQYICRLYAHKIGVLKHFHSLSLSFAWQGRWDPSAGGALVLAALTALAALAALAVSLAASTASLCRYVLSHGIKGKHAGNLWMFTNTYPLVMSK